MALQQPNSNNNYISINNYDSSNRSKKTNQGFVFYLPCILSQSNIKGIPHYGNNYVPSTYSPTTTGNNNWSFKPGPGS